ncbi:MAG: hypothetical protein LBI18_12250, partial [Planctomycetaceae bacterium]|nr:hypothetical protein [Planctomycetaceae bacterium]
VALPLGNSPLFTDGNLYCQMVWNLIASRKQGLIGFRRCDHHPPSFGKTSPIFFRQNITHLLSAEGYPSLFPFGVPCRSPLATF